MTLSSTPVPLPALPPLTVPRYGFLLQAWLFYASISTNSLYNDPILIVTAEHTRRTAGERGERWTRSKGGESTTKRLKHDRMGVQGGGKRVGGEAERHAECGSVARK